MIKAGGQRPCVLGWAGAGTCDVSCWEPRHRWTSSAHGTGPAPPAPHCLVPGLTMAVYTYGNTHHHTKDILSNQAFLSQINIKITEYE